MTQQKLFRVTAPYVTVRVNAPTASGGETVLGFYEGGILPVHAIPESVQSLIDKGMVEEVVGAEASRLKKDAEADAEAEEKIAEDRREAAAKEAEEKRAEEKKAADALAEEQADAGTQPRPAVAAKSTGTTPAKSSTAPKLTDK